MTRRAELEVHLKRKLDDAIIRKAAANGAYLCADGLANAAEGAV